MLLEIKVVPGSKGFALSFRNGWRANVAAQPEKGKANLELEKELGNLLSCPVRVVRGHSSRRKVLEIGIDESEFRMRTSSLINRNDNRTSREDTNRKQIGK